MNKPVNKIEKLIAELCPEWVEFKSLMSVFLIKNGRKDRKDAVEEGIYRFFTRSSIPMRIDSYSFDGEAIVCPGEGNIGAIHYVNEKFDAHQRTYVLQTQSNNVNTKFVYYFMATHWGQANSGMQSGSTVSSIRMANFTNFKIPIPPLAIQQEIVKILDTFTTLEAELEAELEARKKQYEYYREELLTFGDEVELKTLGDVAEVCSGATPASGVATYWKDGTISWMSSGEVNKGTIYDTDKKITQAGYDSCSTKMVPPNAVVIALAGQGTTRGKVARTRISLCTNQSLCSIISNESVNSDFLYYFLQTQYQQLRSVSAGDGARGGLNLQMIRIYQVPVLPLAEQERIVAILDKFDALVNDISVGLPAELNARRKQYEYYRDKLLTFQGKNNEIQ